MRIVVEVSLKKDEGPKCDESSVVDALMISIEDLGMIEVQDPENEDISMYEVTNTRFLPSP